MIRLARLVSTLGLALLAGPAFGWSLAEHRRIATLAIEHGAPELAAFLRAHSADVLRGAVDPDVRFMDAENHSYEVADGTRRNPRRVAEVAAALAAMLRDGAPGETVAYWFGVLSHYVSDVDQPLHSSDRDKGEVWFHALFESLDAGVDARGRVLGVDVRLTIGRALADWTFADDGTRDPIDDVEAWQIANARWSHRYYDEIGRRYRDGEADDGTLAAIYRTCLDEAVNDVLDAWAQVARTAGGERIALPSEDDVLFLAVDDDGTLRRDGESLSAAGLAAAVRRHRARPGALAAAVVEIDDRCAPAAADRAVAACRAAGIERVFTVRRRMGSAPSRFFRAFTTHAASLLRG